MIKADGTDSKQVSNKPTSWSKIFFFFFPSSGSLIIRQMILAASEILKTIIPKISRNNCILYTKLWVDVQQGEDEGEFLVFLLPEESYEADNVVEKEWS